LASLREVLLRFSIRDTGIGIPADKLERIFAPFEQADSSTTREHGGTGLGLSICTQLVALLDGRLWVESKEGEGSTFHFTAKLQVDQTKREPRPDGAEQPRARGNAPGAAPGPMATPGASLGGLPVLVVVGNERERMALENLLAGWGMRPAGVGSASAAFAQLIQAVVEGTPYAFVILEERLPDSTGWDLARQIERTAMTCRTIVVHDPTSSPNPPTGAAAHLTRPMRSRDLLRVLDDLAPRDGQTSTLLESGVRRQESGVRKEPAVPDP
jgi:hypothetical protein